MKDYNVHRFYKEYILGSPSTSFYSFENVLPQLFAFSHRQRFLMANITLCNVQVYTMSIRVHVDYAKTSN